MIKKPLASLLIVVSTSGLLGCASIPEVDKNPADPWESYNRGMHNFNTVVDNATLKPVAKGYRKIIPSPARRGVSNFFQNLSTPGSMINNFLQGKPSRGFSELARFAVNSTIGIGGLIDIATASGIEEYSEDFGQTAAVWGVPSGPFVMLPFLGPSTVRGAVARPIDRLADPLYHYDNTSVRDPLIVLSIIDLRYRLLVTDKILEDSKDAYVTIRESYLQNREFQIFDGDPPDDDDFFDEFLEDEFLEEEDLD